MLHCSRWFFPVLVGQTPPSRNISRSMPLAQWQRQGFLVSVTWVRVSACMSVTPAVSYLFIGLAGCSVGPGISCGVCKLAWTPQIKKKKKSRSMPKIEPGASHTQNEKHSKRPNALLRSLTEQYLQIRFLRCKMDRAMPMRNHIYDRW
jgi:hypothetical protein